MNIIYIDNIGFISSVRAVFDQSAGLIKIFQADNQSDI